MGEKPSTRRMIICALVVVGFAAAVDVVVQKRSQPPLPPESGKAILKNVVSGTDAGDEDIKKLTSENGKL
jgi:hypothetical protein